MAKTVNQNSGCTIVINFYDDNNRSVVPASASYKITDVNSVITLKEETDISDSNLAAEISIEVAPEIHAVRNQKLNVEPKAFTVSYTYWNGTQLVPRTAELIYGVVRLYGKSTEDGIL